MVSADNTGSDTPSSPAPARSQDQQARSSYSTENRPQFYSSYSSGGDDNSQRPYRPQRQYNNQGGYSRDNRGYNNNRQGGYNNNRYNNNTQGGYNRDNRGYNNNRQGGYNNNRYNNNQGGYNRDNNRAGGYQRRPQNNRFNNNRRPNNRNAAPKQLLVSREQLEQIELLYKLMLPLPNPDAHEVIGEKLV